MKADTLEQLMQLAIEKTKEGMKWGQTPFVNSNGTGSGDQLLDTGSYTNISARYLQLRITLRSDISGSI